MNQPLIYDHPPAKEKYLVDESESDQPEHENLVWSPQEVAQQIVLPESEFESSRPMPYREDGLNTYVDAFVLIQTVKTTDRLVIHQAPCKPLASGQVYVYALKDGQTPADWRTDGFQWCNLRANSFPKKNPQQTMTRHEFRLVSQGQKVDFFRHEYHEAGQKFKTPISLKDWKYGVIVIHYFGNFPVNEAVGTPYANRRHVGDKRKVPAKNSKRKVDKLVESATGSERLGQEVIITENGEIRTPSLKPKKKHRPKKAKQIQCLTEIDGTFEAPIDFQVCEEIDATPSTGAIGDNIFSLSHDESVIEIQPLTQDDLFGCYVFQESMAQHNKVIRALDLTNGMNIIIAEDRFLKHVNSVLHSRISTGIVKFMYQSVGQLDRFIISALFMKHPIFENEPNVPVAVFLHRTNDQESHTRFFKTSKELIPALNSSATELTVSVKSEAFASAKGELSENPTIQCAATIPLKTLSPKLDFVLGSVLSNTNCICDHVKIIHLAYFLQCHFLSDIARSLLGNCGGDLSIKSSYDSITCANPSLAEILLPSGIGEVEDDIAPPDLIAMLTRKPPEVLGSGSNYSGSSPNELQLFEGLAYFFLVKNRVEWNKDKALFTIRGLGGKQYIVKLSDRICTCTCLRQKACEHLMAVLIGTGLLAKQQ